MASTPVFLPGESPWTEEPGRLQPWGRKESDTTERLSTAQHREVVKETDLGSDSPTFTSWLNHL